MRSVPNGTASVGLSSRCSKSLADFCGLGCAAFTTLRVVDDVQRDPACAGVESGAVDDPGGLEFRTIAALESSGLGGAGGQDQQIGFEAVKGY